MTVDELLRDHSPHVAALTRRVIAHIDGAADWADRRVYRGWHGVGFHHEAAGYVVGVFPQQDGVRVLFEHGHLLGLARFLQGTGQTRYIELADWDDDRIEAIDDLIDRALIV